jgi:hypothetical protein
MDLEFEEWGRKYVSVREWEWEWVNKKEWKREREKNTACSDEVFTVLKRRTGFNTMKEIGMITHFAKLHNDIQ